LFVYGQNETKGIVACKDLRSLQQAIYLAGKMGESVGAGKILQRPVQAKKVGPLSYSDKNIGSWF